MSAPGQLPPVVVHPAAGPPQAPSWRGRAIRAALLVWPVAELAALIEVGAHLGVGLTLLLLLAGVVAGSLVLRAVGLAAVARLASSPPGGPPGPLGPGRPPAETALVVTAGLLLILPGFLSDAAALALLLPPVRRRLARRAGEAVMRRLRVRSVRVVQGQVIDDAPGAAADDGIRIVRALEGDAPAGRHDPRSGSRAAR
jgi:UPF0716 protein FxsA